MVTSTDAPGFDSLAYAQRLRKADFDEKQATALAEGLRDMTQGVATKADIARLEDKMAMMATKADLLALYRALWIQTAAIAGVVVAAFAGIVTTFINLLPS